MTRPRKRPPTSPQELARLEALAKAAYQNRNAMINPSTHEKR
jgi:hypothetical protein